VRDKLLHTVLPVVTGIWLAGAIVAAFMAVPPISGLGELGRIAWFHIPSAWVSVLAFAVATVNSIIYLARRGIEADDRAVAAAGLGLLFALIATISGAFWARRAWGVFWNWDPREASIVILLLLYGAYFALRAAIDDERRRGVLAAAYNIAAFITVPYLVFVVPRVMESLHPDPVVNADGSGGMAGDMMGVLILTTIGFTLLFLWIFSIAVRYIRLRREVLHGGAL